MFRLTATRLPNMPIGVMPVDSIFTPIRKVNYTVENTRVGQMTDYDKLTLEVWTDGSILPNEATGLRGKDSRPTICACLSTSPRTLSAWT